MNWFADHLLFPFPRGVIGRTLYADMRWMEEYLRIEFGILNDSEATRIAHGASEEVGPRAASI